MMLPARFTVANGAICQAYGTHPCIESVPQMYSTSPSTESMKDLCLIKLPRYFLPD